MTNEDHDKTDSANIVTQNNISTIEIDINKLRTRIDEVLFYKWDPIHFSDSNGPRDEYISYVEPILKMLLAGATPQAIADHLSFIVSQTMGLIRSVETDRATAQLLYCIAHDQECFPDHSMIGLD